MTNEEAIKVLESLGPHGSDEYGWFESGNAIVLAIEALEKQIEKKPLDADITNERGYGKCPTCGEVVNTFDNHIFCDCGQKLDWGDNE